MAIKINDNLMRVQYEAAKNQFAFNVPFPFYKQDYLRVWKRAFADSPNNETQLLELGDDYTVTGMGQETGGQVFLVVPADQGDVITIESREPVDRVSVFDDLNPFTVAMNQQLNELTIMVQQLNTAQQQLIPKYYHPELVNDEVRKDNLYLPILNDGYIWVGRGNYGDNPDDVTTVLLSTVVQSVLSAEFLVQNPDPSLPNAVALSDLNTGIMVNDGGALSTNIIQGVPNQIIVTNGDGTGGPITIGIAPGADSGASQTFNQPGHGLAKGDWVRFDGVNYVKALANTAANAEAIGVISLVNGDDITVQQSSFIADLGAANYLPLIPGDVYFLSTTSSGEITDVEPNQDGYVGRPCLLATSDKGGWIYPYRGQVIGNSGNSAAAPSLGDNQVVIDAPGHSFIVGDVVRVSGPSTFALAQANSETNSRAVGMIVAESFGGDADKFVLQTEGYTDVFSGLIPQTQYYLSAATPGEITSVRPDTLGSWVKPMFASLDTGKGFILEQLPLPVNQANESPTFISASQAGGFPVETVLYISADDTYAPAIATNLTLGDAVGIVVQSNGDDFVLQTNGFTTKILGKAPATKYWLSATDAGDLTDTEPSLSGQVSKPMYKALTANSGYILEQRPMLQPNANGGAGGGGGGGNGQPVQSKFFRTSEIWASPFGPGGHWASVPPNIFSITIQPSNASNLIHIDLSVSLFLGSADNVGLLRLRRNGVIFGTPSGFSDGALAGYTRAPYSPGTIVTISAMDEDEPNTTDLLTYTLDIRCSDTARLNVGFNQFQRNVSSIRVTEITPY